MYEINKFPATTVADAADLAATTSVMNPIQEFLASHYEFRRNVLNGKCEYRTRENNNVQPFKPLTPEDLNSVILAAEAALPDEKRLRERVRTIIESRETPDYDPVNSRLDHLPQWDGLNYVDKFLDRIPGLTAFHRYIAHIWLRGFIAQCRHLSWLHGNELVLTLIGDQGCGKSTFCRLLVPEALREYFLDHVNLANKFDKEMALTNNILVNIDELEQVKRSQQAELKHLITKSRVNGRPIYHRTQQDRLRYASFTATTNNRHPLHDPTGSRRFLCLEIPSGAIIDNDAPIDYDQLYAQIQAELDSGERYWLTEDEIAALERANAPYQSTLDLERIVADCLRKPEPDEPCQPLGLSVLVDIIRRSYPFIQPTQTTKSQLGRALLGLGFESRRESYGTLYLAVPREAMKV